MHAAKTVALKMSGISSWTLVMDGSKERECVLTRAIYLWTVKQERGRIHPHDCKEVGLHYSCRYRVLEIAYRNILSDPTLRKNLVSALFCEGLVKSTETASNAAIFAETNEE